MICGNRVVNQLIVAGNVFIKPWTLIQEFTSAVKKFFVRQLILIFHNLVLKQPEECKTLCKLLRVSTTKILTGLWKTTSVNSQPNRATVFEKSNHLQPLTESFRKNGSPWCGACHQTPGRFPDSCGSSVACKDT